MIRSQFELEHELTFQANLGFNASKIETKRLTPSSLEERNMSEFTNNNQIMGHNDSGFGNDQIKFN